MSVEATNDNQASGDGADRSVTLAVKLTQIFRELPPRDQEALVSLAADIHRRQPSPPAKAPTISL
jgi:hypothetical protein